MNPTKDKTVFGIATVISFPLLYYIILRISPNIGTEPHRFISLVGALLALLNVTILTGYLSFGRIGAVIITFASSVPVLLLASAYHINLFYLNLIAFLGSFLLGHKHAARMSRLSQLHKVETQELEERNNTLTMELERHRSQDDSLKKKLARFIALKDVIELFSGSLSLEQTIKLITENSHRLVGKSERTLFYMVDTKNQELVLMDSRQTEGFPKIKSKKGDIFDRFVLKQKQPLSILDVDKDFRFSQEDVKERGWDFKSLISYPVVAEKRLLGLVHMDSRKQDNFTPDDLRLLGIISDVGAVAIQNALFYQRTIELAIRDSLTNLFVHRYFRERLNDELERSYLRNYSLSLLMIDIDHFKKYNDKYGHTAGDILLKDMADIFRSHISPGDIVARYGGEEFAVLLCETEKSQALDIAENIRVNIEKEKFLIRREETRTTVSIGVATFPLDAKSSADLLNTADRNLYRAKREGRNKVC